MATVARPEPDGRDGPDGPITIGSVTGRADADRVRPDRTGSVPGGGFDRVGGSRLTGTGAVLVGVVLVVIAAPPDGVDQELMSVLWASLLAVLVVGIVVPLVMIRRIVPSAESPADAVVGEHVPLTVSLSGRSPGVEVRALDPTGPWCRAAVPDTGEIDHLADRRGVFHAVRVEVRVTAPLGILAAHRVHDLALPRPVAVAPRSTPVTWRATPAPVDGGFIDRSQPSPTGESVRSVRPYVSGDPSHLVHWPSSARLGALVVRELEPPSPLGQAVVVDLRDLGEDTERAAEYAFGACRAVLATGGHLMLATCEVTGPAVREARTILDVGRRLAAAVPGPPGIPPAGWPVVEIGR